MAPKLLQDIVSNARVKNLTPQKSRGGRKGDGGGEGKAGLAVTLLSVQISFHHTSALDI